MTGKRLPDDFLANFQSTSSRIISQIRCLITDFQFIFARDVNHFMCFEIVTFIFIEMSCFHLDSVSVCTKCISYFIANDKKCKLTPLCLMNVLHSTVYGGVLQLLVSLFRNELHVGFGQYRTHFTYMSKTKSKITAKRNILAKYIQPSILLIQ